MFPHTRFYDDIKLIIMPMTIRSTVLLIDIHDVQFW